METTQRLTDYKVPTYTRNAAFFDRYLLDHREHQVQALIGACAANKGQIISPCGTGKTRIQVSMHLDQMIYPDSEQSGVFVIASHRLSLNLQLLNQIVHVAINCGLPIDILYIGSYKCDLNKYYEKYHRLGYNPKVSRHLATTSPKLIEAFVQESRELNRHVIVASTYDSFASLKISE